MGFYTGTPGDDTIFGDNDEVNFIQGLEGNDRLIGSDVQEPSNQGEGAGGDVLWGGADNDTLFGLGANDLLQGDDGDDRLVGGDGDDLLRGGAGDDRFDGGDGFDRVSFSTATPHLNGIVADLRTQRVLNDGFGNAENMKSIEGLGAGSQFADQFYGNDVANHLFGAAGDTVLGFGGDDMITIDQLPALFDGGDGFDLLNLRGGGGRIEADLGQQLVTNDGFGGSGVIAGFESLSARAAAGAVLRGGEGDNVLQMFGDSADTLTGFGGDDTMEGFGGDDTVTGGNGNDSIAGDDFVFTVSRIDFETFLPTAIGADTLDGGDGGDTMSGGNADDSLTGGRGADSIAGDYFSFTRFVEPDGDFVGPIEGADSIAGGRGDDTIVGNGGDDQINGGAQRDLIDGGMGDDSLRGGNGADRLDGFGGDDQLNGGGGRDVIRDDAGRDLLIGGEDDDRFVFLDHSFVSTVIKGADRIADFAAGDLLDLRRVDAVDGGNDDAFTFISDAQFTGTAGELRYEYDAARDITGVYGDTNADAIADFAIALTGEIVLQASDFLQ